MVRTKSRIGTKAGQYLMVATLTGLLVGCGGGASTDDELGQQDFDNDGTINIEDPDADGDGIDDIEDTFIDLDSDDLDDFSGLTQEQIDANNNTNPDDLDGDGFTDVSATHVCGSENGDDNNSSTPSWNDNCVIKRSTVGGQFADSLFAVGIQRILFCEGFNTGSATTYQAYADGEYGPTSEANMIAFQTAEGIPADGIVGEQTWARLRARLELLAADTSFNANGIAIDTYGFATGPCAGIPMFYQDIVVISAGANEGNPDKWFMARDVPNEAQSIPFSYQNSFLSEFAR